MYRKALIWILATALIWSGAVTSAAAAVVGTAPALAMESRQQRLAAAEAALARADVQAAMVRLGVDPAEARSRVASLDDAELVQLTDRLETLPAGGLLELIGAVFVILLILELTGVIDIFKKA